MKEKGQQVQREQDGCQVFLAVTEVVLDMIPFGGEDIMPFIFMFSACATRMSNGFDLLVIYREVGDEAITVETFTTQFMGDS